VATPNPVDVYVSMKGRELLAGRLWHHRRGRSESATFSYDADYLADPDAYDLDPALPLVGGQLQTAAGRSLFGSFSDCAPDRWGRRLIDRDERHRVDLDGGPARSFADVDYLVGVRDDLRQGALRFRNPETGIFLATPSHGVPYLIDLPVLLHAAEHMERGDATAEEVRTLLEGGSSLGGARPKAHVLNSDGQIAIAKFPSPVNDQWDVIRWEAVALELASRCGIRVPNWNLHTIEGKAVLIIDRFDRNADIRIGYVSAMTLLEATDGDDGSYIEIAEAFIDWALDPEVDLAQLWRRIAFYLLISNTDDHLRNHGFLCVSTAGWQLSPAFDINPDPRPGTNRRSTAIDRGQESSVATLLDVAPIFGLSETEAQSVLSEVCESTTQWREAAEEMGLSKAAIGEMTSAFENEHIVEARKLPA